MTSFNNLKTILCILFSIHAITAQSITFKPTRIDETSESNYLKFEGGSFRASNSFEKIAADFNGDGFDDILSLGGDSALINEVPNSYNSALIEMMIYHEGNYITHDLNLDNFSNKANIVDIDADGDLDIVMMNGEIAINDGLANFSTVEFSNTRYLSDDFFTVDIDADGDLDIVSKEFVFHNNGDLTFTEAANNITAESELFHIVDINQDSFADIININSNELQSWINDGSGNFELVSSIQVPDDVFIIHNPSTSGGNQQNLLVVFHDNPQDKILLLHNDGEGNFETNQLILTTENIDFETLRIGKLYNQDFNKDEFSELMIAATFVNNTACQNTQNILLIYSQSSDGNFQHQITIHSEGAIKENAIDTKMTVDNLPTIVDMNNDQLPDVVFNGDRPHTWLSQEVSYNHIGTSFQLSQASKNQYIKNIDTADYDNDGYQDVFSAAMYSGNCPVLDYAEGFITAADNIQSTLLINDGKGGFNSFSSPFGGGNDFFRPYEYMIFADLENDGIQNIIATIPETDNQPQESYYIYPRLVDPGLAFKLPEATTNAKVINLDSTGKNKEIIMIANTQEAPIIVLAFSNGQFLEIARLDFGANNGVFGINSEFKLADMDGDGNIDIITSQNNGGSNTTNIWYNNGNREFTKSQDYADNAFGIAVLDINNDGLLDLFSSSRDIRLNQGNREFEKVSYDSNFWSLPWGLGSIHNLVPKKMHVIDFNNDGKDDVLFSNHNDYYVYINDSTEDKILFYSAYITKFNSNSALFNSSFDHYNAALTDINNDNKVDFVINTGNKIQLHTQIQEQAVAGLYYDPTFSGHGFSINNIGRGNLYYSVFYSYDEQGKPEWYSTLNRYTGYETEYESRYYFTAFEFRDELRYMYDYTTQTAQANPDDQYIGNMTFSSTNINKTLDGMNYFIGDEYGSWNIQPIIHESQKPEVDFSGIWWAGPNDSGWGISLSFVQREFTQEVVTTLYFYDETGEPRWLIGQQDGFQPNQDIIINMEQVNGFPRDQNHVELTRIPAGTITLNLNQPSNNLNEAGTMTMNVFYPDDLLNQNNWMRNNIPISLFSSPES